MTVGKNLSFLLLALLIATSTHCLSAETLSPELYRRDAVENRLRRLGPRPIEGLWLLTAGNSTKALIAIERTDSSFFDTGSYRLVVVEAEDRSIVPGTVIGNATAAIRSNEFDARIASDIKSGIPIRYNNYTLTLIDGSDRLEISKRSSKFKINFYAAIPYLFVRPSITSRDGAKTNPPAPGAIRIFPRPSKPQTPIYL